MADILERFADALLAFSGFNPPPQAASTALNKDSTAAVRKAFGGNIQPLPSTKLRWYLADLERAQAQADTGNIRMVARLYKAMRRDGALIGILGTRTDGLVRLPKRFYGDEDISADLRSKNGTRSVFDEMAPPAELGLLAGDGIVLGVGVAELVPVVGRDYPVLVRLDPEFLDYFWADNYWYFNSIAGRIAVTPGDGRWVLHMPGGRMSPWNSGVWPALGRAFINKEHAMLHRSNFSRKLANPGIAAFTAQGAAEQERKGFFRRLLNWGMNNVFELPPGWDIKVIETNGRAWQVFQQEIDTCDNEYMVCLAGQIVTTTGGAGFANADIHQSIRKDLIQATGENLAYTVNTQIIPQYVLQHFGEDALYHRSVWVEWDTNASDDRQREAATLNQLGQAIKAVDEAIAPHDKRVDVDELLVRNNVPWHKGKITPEAEKAVNAMGLQVDKSKVAVHGDE